MYLYKYKIPFRYECELQLEGVTYYPDFTIRHPKTGQLYYWEHLGMMDNPSYVDKVYEKLKVFNRNHIIQSVNLITSYETKINPLNAKNIEDIIQYYLL